MKKGIFITLILIGISYLLLINIAPDKVEKDLNGITLTKPYQISEQAKTLYDSLEFIGDLHCDALLWDRDLNKDSEYGHVDIPKMQQANIALQAFTIVTKSPKGQNFEHNEADALDNITLLGMVQGRPPGYWFSLMNRALYQSKKLKKTAKRSDGDFKIISSSKDLKGLISLRKSDPTIVGGFLGVEGAHALEGKLKNVDELFEAGGRMMGPTHFFDNELGGSAHGVSGEGLTDFGEEVIDRMNELKMIIDLAHISPAMIDDILERTTQPVLVSHTGVDAVYDSPRNLSDQHIRAIGENGGLIGIAFFPGAIGDGGIPAIVASMKHVKDLIGIEHVALGSDYDGSVVVPFDITGLPLLIDEMLAQNFTTSEIKAIMGENMKRFMLANLPEE